MRGMELLGASGTEGVSTGSRILKVLPALAWLSLIVGSSVAESIEATVEEVEFGGVRSFIVGLGGEYKVVPAELRLGTPGQEGISAILQSVPALEGPDSYFLALTGVYSLATYDASAGSSVRSLANAQKVDLISNFPYVTYAAIWVPATQRYELRTIDQGNIVGASSLVLSMEVEFPTIEDVADFLQQPQPLALIVELRPELQFQISRRTPDIPALVAEVLKDQPPELQFRAFKDLGKVLEAHPELGVNNIDPLSREVSANAYAQELSYDGVELRATEGSGQNLARTGITSSTGVPFRVTDRVFLQQELALCVAPTRFLVIDTGKTGCEAVSDLMAEKQ